MREIAREFGLEIAADASDYLENQPGEARDREGAPRARFGRVFFVFSGVSSRRARQPRRNPVNRLAGAAVPLAAQPAVVKTGAPPVESGRRQTICLCMIVKNEAPVIEQCLSSVRPAVDYWVVVDTGSTDGTQDIVARYFEDIPGELHRRPWRLRP